eukprot:scaffold121536_cov21-Tisochrysis_lutea.AAC.4
MCWGSKSAPLLSSNFGHDHFTACRWVCKRAACFELLSFAVFQELSIVFGLLYVWSVPCSQSHFLPKLHQREA